MMGSSTMKVVKSFSRINLGKGTDTVSFGAHEVGSSTDFNATILQGLASNAASAEAGDTYNVQLATPQQ